MVPFAVETLNILKIENNKPTNQKEQNPLSVTSLTQGNPTESNAIKIPKIELPKGGGAIKSIDENFEVNASNGTATIIVPLPFSPGRNGQTPQIGLSYNTGGGNSVFGLGWGLGIPNIQRKTEKELPQYKDAEESDTFIVSGAEDLVPVLNEVAGEHQRLIIQDGDKTIHRYRPRIEGLFSRIERITENGNQYWKIRSKDNVVSVFGESQDSRISNPKDNTQIFRWNLEYSFDDKGNFTKYIYKQENDINLAKQVSEKNRTSGLAPFSNTYLKCVLYGNKTAFYQGDNMPTDPDDFMFQMILDYGEHDQNKPTPVETNDWKTRLDPFSSYRSGFEIRTYRRCHRILMFHRFDELSPNPYCVRSLEFEYDENPNFSYLDSVTQSGYIWTPGGNLKTKESLPPLTYRYSKNPFNREVKTISTDNLHSSPAGLADGQFQWTDLHSEGLSGILSEQGDGWYYKSNLGDGEFTPASLVTPKPSYSGLSDGTLSLQELEGNGIKYLVQNGRSGGYFELNKCDGWRSYETFDSYPNIDLQDPNLKFLDLNGDGLPDILLSMENEFLWYAGKGKLGYDDYQVAHKVSGEEKGPQVLFSDATEQLMIVTTDMSGDGLSDIVLIKNNQVAYYPNLGYGRFGAKVTLEMGGNFDHSDQFNPKYIHLADIDGSGTTDIIYVGKNKIQVRYNHAGNSLSTPDEFYNPFPNIDNQTRISVIDLLGTGTSCIVWSSSLPADRESPLRYIDVTNGQKPHVMIEYFNNMGKVVNFQYKSSTYYYLQDKKAGKPWITRLPFPVQCVDKVITEDRVSQWRFTNQYIYHHGYYDGIEREFRGFAMVEQKDTEVFDHYVAETINANAVNIVKEDLYQPTVITKSWFHTGAYTCRERYIHQLQEEYYPNGIDGITEPTVNYILPDYKIPNDLEADELSECYRALKGLPLRQEIYSEEGDRELQKHPYTITQFNYNIQKLQSKAIGKHAIFLTTEKENLAFTLERNPGDPRINHNINIAIDQFGNILESAAIVYGRITEDSSLPSNNDRQKQATRHIIYTQNQFTKVIDIEDIYRLALPCETQTFELKSNNPSGQFYSSDELQNVFTNAIAKPYESSLSMNEKRSIELSRILYLKDDLTGPMPFGQMDTRALPFQNYVLAFTPSLIPHLYGTKVTDAFLRNSGQYVRFKGDDNYWVRSGLTHFHPDLSTDMNISFIPTPTLADVEFAKNNFFLPSVFEDQVGNLTKVIFDNYQLYMKRSMDALGNEINVLKYQYRTLSPWLLSDPNGNRSGIRYNAFGLPTSVFVMGKESENMGDRLTISSEETNGNDRPSIVMTYEWNRYMNSNPDNIPPTDSSYPDIVANRVYSKAFENHFYDDNGASQSQLKSQRSFTYSDGSGNVVLEKINAEPGEVLKVDASGNKVTVPANSRWVGSGRTILNNKGNPVKQYEPFFDDNSEYTKEDNLVCQGFSPTIYYDALGRVIKTENPNGTLTKVSFDAWSQTHYDANDTVLESQWFLEKLALPTSDPGHIAALKTEVHSDTPAKAHLDTLGRIFLTIDHNKGQRSGENDPFDIKIETRVNYDIESNPLKVIDARGNVVMCWKYNMLGHQVYQQSMDAGERWVLPDALQRELRKWDSRNHITTQFYDDLNRPLYSEVEDGLGNTITYERYIYGESQINQEQNNLRGQLFHLYDTAGKVQVAQYDFKGNPILTDRVLCTDYHQTPDWPIADSIVALSNQLQATGFNSQIKYDALNRPIESITPDNSIHTPVYNEAGLLDQMKVKVRNHGAFKTFIKNIDYNAKGQRLSIRYGNNTTTSYKYNLKDYRLERLTTKKGSTFLQDLNYTYDPVGNITQIFDNAQKTKFYNGQKIEQKNEYTYDSLYQLIEATGREHRGQVNLGTSDNWDDSWCQNNLATGDDMNLRNYTQKYQYDAVGNILQMKHHVQYSGHRWTRNYQYHSNNNQLLRTSIGSQSYNYAYDDHGSIKTLKHFQGDANWNFREELQHVKVGTQDVYFVYDSQGQRIRKVVHKDNGQKCERIYIGDFEIYRELDGNGDIELERESLHVNDDTGRIALVESLTIDNSQSPILNTQLIRYQYTNHLSTSTLELDESGNPISYEEYHPFGTSSYRAVNSSIESSAKRYRYTGKERDEETGLYYHGARYYLCWLGRWLKADPGGMVDGANLYNYVSNCPTKLSDENGLKGGSNTEEPNGEWKKYPSLLTGGDNDGLVDTLPEFENWAKTNNINYSGLPSYNSESNKWENVTIFESDSAVNLKEVEVSGKKPLFTKGELAGLGVSIALGIGLGILAVATGGIGALLLAGAVAGVAGYVTESYIDDKEITGEGIATQAILGATVELVFKGVGKMAKPIFSKLKIGKLFKKTIRTEEEIIQRAVNSAEKSIGGTGMEAGRLKHKYVENFVQKYQKSFQNLSLETEVNYLKIGPHRLKGAGFQRIKTNVRLDIFSNKSGKIYDAKFSIFDKTDLLKTYKAQMAKQSLRGPIGNSGVSLITPELLNPIKSMRWW